MSRLRRVLGYVSPYRARLALAGFLTVTLTLSALPMPLIMQFLIDDVLGKRRPSLLPYILLGIIFLNLLRAGLSYLQTYSLTYVSQRVGFDLRRQMFRHLQRLSLSFFDKRQTGKIMSRIMDDVAIIRDLGSGQLIQLFTDVLTFLAIIAIILNKDWRLALVSLSVLPLYVLNYRYFVWKIQSVSKSIRETMDTILGGLQETIAGALVVKAFAQERRETEQFRQDTWQNLELSMKRGVLSMYFSSAAGLISGAGTALVLCFGGYEVIRGHITIGGLMAFYGFIGYLYGPAVRLSQVNDMIQRALVSVDRVFELLDTRPDVEDTGTIELPKIRGRVEFRDICFGYVPDRFVLDSISLVAEPGTIVALVGHTGCGKTTLVNLIPRFYDSVLGSILIDGYDIREVTLDSLRAQIGIVLQESVLFDDTVRNNIRYGRTEATDDEVVAAARAANIHDFIVSLPDGYDTKIGEDGVKLSIGQNQRLSIARAIVADPRILILDEATSSLDSESEALIQEALKRVMQARTCFVIAHRLSTIIEADVIVAMEKGKIVETGTHAELLARNGLYSRLYDEQFRVVHRRARAASQRAQLPARPPAR